MPLVFYLSLMLFFSTRSFPAVAAVAPDFLLHGAEYFFLGAFMIRAFNDGFHYLISRRIIWLSLGFCLGLAILDEWLQRSIPNRVGSFGDVVSDATGAVLAVLAVMTIQKILTRPVRPESG